MYNNSYFNFINVTRVLLSLTDKICISKKPTKQKKATIVYYWIIKIQLKLFVWDNLSTD